MTLKELPKLDGEVFVQVEGYDHYYISNMGRIFSEYKGGLLKHSVNQKGYHFVKLSKDGRQTSKTVNNLIGQAFLENPDPSVYIDVAHWPNEDKSDNRACNLHWATRKQNCNEGKRNENLRKSTGQWVECIETGEVFLSTRDVEEKLGIDHSNIVRVCNGTQKSTRGLHFRYIPKEEKEEEVKK